MPTAVHDRIIADLVRIYREGPSPFIGCLESDFKTSLGLIGGISPASIPEDLEAMVAVPADTFPSEKD
ncbi:hypothetical protein H9Q09_12285 [Aurantimonas sp. DM33-3]|nr:hypothetical protein [Aurantimonas sp. DM33-3]